MNIREATLSDMADLVRMGRLLWDDDSEELLRDEFAAAIADDDQSCLTATAEDEPAGFVLASLRKEHVPGAETAPVGYLEGLFVHEQYRRQGVAKAMTERAEQWAREKGCTEMGSDTWDWNKESERFHNSVGYRTYETLIHFIKKL